MLLFNNNEYLCYLVVLLRKEGARQKEVAINVIIEIK